MGMRLDLRKTRESGGGCRSGMADSSDSPRLAALRGLEDSLRWHREAQASRTPARTPAQMPEHAVAPDAEPDDIFADEALPPMPIRRRRIAIPAVLRGRA